MSKTEHLTGLIAAPHTPFDKNGEIAWDVIPRQAELLIRKGLTGAYISGSTGEGISCSVEERLKVMERWHEAAQGKLKLIVHIGALSLKDVETLGRRADELGVFAVSLVPANYFKPATVELLVRYCRKAAAFAPHCRFYYYHSSLSGINLPMPEFLEKADGVIPTLAGIKFNSMNLYEYQLCRRALGGKYDIVYGTDEFYAGARALGARGFIGSTYNYQSDLYFEIDRAFDRGDWEAVEAGMNKVCRGVDLLVRYGGVACGKVLMATQGIDAGDPRLPLAALTAEQKQSILREYGEIMNGK